MESQPSVAELPLERQPNNDAEHAEGGEPEPAKELRCTICGLRACWTR
jgi:hypothetical protein